MAMATTSRMVDVPVPTTKATRTRAGKRSNRGPIGPIGPTGSEATLDDVRDFGLEAGKEAWRKLVDEHSRPYLVAWDPEWREPKVAEGLAALAKWMGQEPTDRERGAYLANWANVLDRRAHEAEEESEPRPAIKEYEEPRTPAELANVLRHFLLDAFDAAPMAGHLTNGADFEVGLEHAELTVAVLSQSVWRQAREAVNQAIKAQMRR